MGYLELLRSFYTIIEGIVRCFFLNLEGLKED
jgi:hypothetical protein